MKPILLAAAVALCAAPAQAAEQPAPASRAGAADNKAPWIKEGTNTTGITSRSLEYDPEKREAVFKDNVKVEDADVTITSDRLTVLFDPQNKPSYITAEGAVCIMQTDRVATAKKAVYNVAAGEVVLMGEPQVQQGKDIMRGEVITFWPGSKRLRCEPNAVLVIHADEETRSETLRLKRD